jgi:hypothetical protein
MIIVRTRVNDHTIEGLTFHPGSQFVSDEAYFKTLKDNLDFKSQVKAGFLKIEVPPEVVKELSPEDVKAGKKTKSKKKSLAETIVDLSEEEAIAILQKTVDAVDLKEVIKLEKRRSVIEVAEAQMEGRSQTLQDLAPKSSTEHPGDIKMDVVE